MTLSLTAIQQVLLCAIASMALAVPPARAQTVSAIGPPATPSAAIPDSVTWIDLSSKQGELRGKLPQLIAAEIAKAKASGQTPFVEIGATWCGPCQALEASLHTQEMMHAFAGAYVIHLDVSEWDEEEEIFPIGIHAQTGWYMPLLVAINPKGHAVAQTFGLTAITIKQFIQAHRWSTTSARPKAVAR